MPAADSQSITLSICITTFNRSAFIGETLESVLSQVTCDCEVVVLDAASGDGTQQVMSEFAARSDRVRYFRGNKNNGFDRDCDRSVELARGKYCWLMTDDDLLKPGAISRVLEALRKNPSLIVVNAQVRDFHMTRVLQHRWLDVESDRSYSVGEMDRLFGDTGEFLKYVGAVVIRRSIWLARERQSYYGSWFIYLGVIFQKPLPEAALVIAEPLVSYRAGNTHNWSPKTVEIVFVRWPLLVASLPISQSAKRKVATAEPWRSVQVLLLLRRAGFYSLSEYRRLVQPRLRAVVEKITRAVVAAVPGVLVNTLFVAFDSIGRGRGARLQLMRESRFYFRNWRTFGGK